LTLKGKILKNPGILGEIFETDPDPSNKKLIQPG